MFCSGLANIYYEKSIQKCLNDNKIQFVAKNKNVTNVPQVRPIERFSALCKRTYSQRAEEPKNIKEFTKIWKDISKTVAQTSAQLFLHRVVFHSLSLHTDIYLPQMEVIIENSYKCTTNRKPS